MTYKYNVVYKINDCVTVHYIGDNDGIPCFSKISETVIFPMDKEDFKVEAVGLFDEHLSRFVVPGIYRNK